MSDHSHKKSIPINSAVSLLFVDHRLQYKYQRLVQSASAAAELPAPEKCIEDDDDDAEGEDGSGGEDVSAEIFFFSD